METHGGRLSAPAVDDNQPLSNTNSNNTKSIADEHQQSPLLKEMKILANKLMEIILILNQ